MPVISKQSPKAVTPSNNGSVLGRIRSVGQGVGSLKVSLYGRPKTGKTRLACTFPKPAIILGFEDGTASVVGVKGVDFIELKHSSEMSEVIAGPIIAGKYQTVILDNGTKFRDVRIAEILGMGEAPVQKGWGFAKRDDWIECANSMKQLLRPLFDQANKQRLNVVIIAQEQNFGDEDGTSGSDLITPAIGSSLGKSVCMFVNAECDYIGQTFIREQTTIKELKIGGNTTTQKQGTGKMEYCLRVGPHPVYMTGFRQHLGAKELPECIVNPDYDKIVKAIKA